MKVIFFDLDNTLYDSQKYYVRAFKSISEYISENSKFEQENIFNFLYKNWKKNTSMYNKIFDDLVKNLELKININHLVKIFNEQVVEENDLFGNTIPVLEKLSEKYKIGIITDGNVARQKRKIQNCKIESLVNEIIYTKLSEPKPSSVPFQHALKSPFLKGDNIEPFYVADNPQIDFLGAKLTNFSTIRIIRGEFKNINSDKNIDYTINNLEEVEDIIDSK
jgi:putative hydrolase of the HAD superfamily